MVLKTLQKKSKAVKVLKNKIIPYSLINKIANKNLLYSMLNPETSSDSPSEKSKGVRFVSATHLIIHIINTGFISKKNLR